ncbi:hypothetical protein HFP57_17090 [Parasphingopyxis algicola]|uniref:hypothetical protein n=1 Tax=Parasphingopyxis algicola TaxID=2026624 RepID=UPI0015A016E3|nr:hypothetical protein [Parasphingopyxis algicola]QLC26581.1 hypothetical protein HFP57_17090 [Parasphingopyxis algicola]
MRRLLGYGLACAIGAALPLAGALAQEVDDTEAVARQAPVFDLPAGRTRERPQPDVQGPRAPGVSPPRLLGEDNDAAASETPPVEIAPIVTPPPSDTAPVATEAQPDAAPASPSAPPAAVAQAPVAEPDAMPADPPSLRSSELSRPPAASAPERMTEPTTTTGDPADSPWWIWLAGMFMLVAFVAAVRIVRTRRSWEAEEVPEPAPLVRKPPEPAARPEPAPEPVAPPPAPVEPAASADQAPLADGDAPTRIEVDFQPLMARLSTLGLTLGYRLRLHNISDEPLRDVSVRLGIRCADDGPLNAAADAEPPCLAIDTLEAGATQTHSGEIRLDPQTFRPLQSHGEPMLVPIVDMMPRYRDGEGVVHEMHATMLVGRELKPPRPKMQPFWLERGFGQFGALGCRMLSVKTA